MRVLSSSTYRVEGVDSPEGDVDLSLGPGRDRKNSRLFSKMRTGSKSERRIIFDADRYQTDLSLLVKRGEETIPQVKVTIGPSIGDQGISYHTFYSVAPEAVAFRQITILNDILRPQSTATAADRLSLNGPIDWAGVADTYFAMVAVPARKTEGLEYRTVAYEHKHNDGTPEKRILVTAFVPIPSDGSRNIIYAGPKDHYLLTDGSEEITGTIQRPIDLDGLIDYGFLGWLSRPLAVPILQAITYLYNLTSSYGVAIILFTIVIYSLFFPLKWRSSKAMKKAQKLAPKMKELQEKIKGLKQNDPRLKELQMDQLRLMKEGNPLGGCLPLLIQMPFLFALYRAITISLDFRQASFLWIPDLSAAEPYLIHILPILMTGTMVVLQLVTPAPSADPLQRKMMAIGMPLFMLYVLWSAPSGLVLYWLVGNIVGFTQQFLINHWTKGDDEEVATPPPAKGPTGTEEKGGRNARPVSEGLSDDDRGFSTSSGVSRERLRTDRAPTARRREAGHRRRSAGYRGQGRGVVAGANGRAARSIAASDQSGFWTKSDGGAATRLRRARVSRHARSGTSGDGKSRCQSSATDGHSFYVRTDERK